MATLGDEPQGDDADYNTLVRTLEDFLSPPDGDGEYTDAIQTMLDSPPPYRLMVDLDDLRRRFGRGPVRALQNQPVTLIRAFEEALKSTALAIGGSKTAFADDPKFHVGFKGSFGGSMVSPRGLTSDLLSTMVCVEGIVTKVSLVRPKVVKSVHYCPSTNKTVERQYRDATSLVGLPTSAAFPSRDENGNALELEFGLSEYKDHQMITIQEMPERAPLGQLPRSVEVIADYDLVDKCKPGDRVQIVGVYRALAGATGQTSSGVFRTVLIANNVRSIGTEVNGLVITPEDVQNIRALAKEDDAFETLSRSLAPSIYGHEYIKKSLLLLLLGGMEKNLDNGTHLRGDINILMVGDPSTAKSQLLRFVLGIAPLAVSTTGRGSTGVGLTAAVTSDAETGERRLEAGAMVLADRGVVCIDEFDKMGDADRVAIHEVMEQQTVTIAKAGIHASLNARCSVVAAANPIYGQYDKDLTPQRNVGLPDSLLSRFDLLFIVLDNLNPDHDRAISDHVLRMHRYERPGQEGVPISLSAGSGVTSVLDDVDAPEKDDDTAPKYQKFDPLLHGGFAEANGGERRELLSTEFIRKYVLYAKTRVKPVLSEDAQDFVANHYSELRQNQATKTLPVTPRQLETMIRLASAHAKVRLSKHVEVQDCEEAYRIMRFALYHEESQRPDVAAASEGEAQMPQQGGEAEEEEAHLSDVENMGPGGLPGRKRRRASDDADDGPEDVEPPPLGASDAGNRKAAPQGKLSGRGGTFTVERNSERFRRCMSAIVDLFKSERSENLPMNDVIRKLNDTLATLQQRGVAENEDAYSRGEVEAIVTALQDDNKVMYSDGVIYQI